MSRRFYFAKFVLVLRNVFIYPAKMQMSDFNFCGKKIYSDFEVISVEQVSLKKLQEKAFLHV